MYYSKYVSLSVDFQVKKINVFTKLISYFNILKVNNLCIGKPIIVLILIIKI